MLSIGIKDAVDILLFAVLLFYIYRLMKESGTINIFYGVLGFIVVWVFAFDILTLRIIYLILDKFKSISMIILFILFYDSIILILKEFRSH